MRIDQNVFIEKTGGKIEGGAQVSVSGESIKTEHTQVAESRGIFSTNVDKGQFLSCSSWEEIMARADSMDIDTLKDKMAVLSNTMTARDYQKLQENGFSLEDTDVETIVTVMDQIKMKLLEAGVDISCFGDLPSRQELEKMAGSEVRTVQLEAALHQQNLPATEENLAEGQTAAECAQTLEPLSDSAKKYMLDNGLEPTIENLYKAEHATSAKTAVQVQQQDLSELEPQMQQIVDQSNLKEKENGMEFSKWLVANDIPLTTENLELLEQLGELTLPAPEETVISGIVSAIAQGQRPAAALLTGEASYAERAKQAYQITMEATDTDVQAVVEKGQPLTIEALAQAQQQRMQKDETDAAEDGSVLTARRQLEEVRLQMTVQANYSLLKQGIQIETEPLEKLVEQLKAAEQAYYENLFDVEGIEASEETISMYRQTGETVEALKEMPAVLLGTTTDKAVTLQVLYEAGRLVSTAIEEAAQTEETAAPAKDATLAVSRYETLMTAPRTDMGDSIQKAFQNVDAILEDLGMEVTKANERAVRILGYNSIDITKESVLEMKLADSQVQSLLENLTPAVTMHLIKNGINPLDTQVNQLNAQIEQIKQENGYDENQRFSEYLWNLEHTEGIEADEREAYIGVYRLVNQIEKADGAVIGALVQQQVPLTMKNLLSAVKTRQSQGIDAAVDDSFGVLEEVSFEKTTIAQQLAKGFHAINTAETDFVDNQAEYEASCAKHVAKWLTPDGVQEIARENGVENQALEEFFEGLTPQQLDEQLKKYEQQEEQADSYARQQLNQMKEAMDTEESVIRLLRDHGMSASVSNMIAGARYFQNRNRLYQQIFGIQMESEEAQADFEAIKQELLERFAEDIKTPEELAKAQEELAEVAENAMKGMLPPDKNVTSLDVRNLKLMQTELKLNTSLAKNEKYAIPVMVEDEMATVHLEIVRGEKEKGKVTIVFDTQSYGKVAAELLDTGKQIEGLIAADRRETVEWLKEAQPELEEALQSEEKTVSLNYAVEENLDLIKFEVGQSVQQSRQQETSPVQTVNLYRMAKVFMASIIKTGKAH